MLKPQSITLFQGAKQLSLQQLMQSQGANPKLIISGSSTLTKYLIATGIINVEELIVAALNFSLPIMYAVSTFIYSQPTMILFTLELLICIILICDFFLRLYLSESIATFLISFNSVLDYISLIPILLGNVLYPRYSFLHYFRVLRMACCLRLNGFFSRNRSIILKRVYNLIIIILSLVLICGCAILEVENSQYNGKTKASTTGDKVKEKLLQFHDIVYFMFVTIGTLGYGDIVPQSAYSKIIVFLGILFTLYLLPAATSDLLKSLDIKSVYKAATYEPIELHSLILLIGRITVKELSPFLEELINPTHKHSQIQANILMDEPPSAEILLLLKQACYYNKISYIQGDPFNFKDLERAGAQYSICTVIFTSQSLKHDIVEDYRSILMAYSLKKFASEKKLSNNRICLQVNFQESKELYLKGQMYTPLFDQVICNEETTLRMLAKNCICPGILTIITSLLTSSSPAIKELTPGQKEEELLAAWALRGTLNHIQRIMLRKEKFGGYMFVDIVMATYKKFNIIMFAIEAWNNDSYQVYVNPHKFRLKYENYFAYCINLKTNFNSFDINTLNIKSVVPNSNSLYVTTNNTTADIKDITHLSPDESPLHKIRDKYIINERASDFADAIIYSVHSHKIKNHLLICGYTSSFSIILSTLRPKMYGNKSPPVVILTNSSAIIDQWEQIKHYSNISIIKGSPLNITDLQRSGVKSASAILILESYNRDTNSDDESESIFIYRTIKNINPHVEVITEICSISNISYLITDSNDLLIKKYDYWACEPFISGELCIHSFLSTYLCQTFFNPMCVDIVNQLLMGNVETPISTQEQQESLGLLECSAFMYNPYEKFITERYTFSNIYLELLAKEKMIIIAIVKRMHKRSKPFVIINPSPEEYVGRNDKLIVLYSQEPTVDPEITKEESNFPSSKRYTTDEKKDDIENSTKLSSIKERLCALSKKLKVK